jgi:hypothetical protein
MNRLTRQQAIELNALFDKMLHSEGERTFGYINVFKVAKEVDLLKDKDTEYIRDLAYVARIEQTKIPHLFSGDSLFALNKSSVSDFLRQGGFVGLYNLRHQELKKEKRNFWITNGLVIITILISIYPIIFSSKEARQANQDQKNLKEESQASHKDSTKLGNPRTNHQIDSIK